MMIFFVVLIRKNEEIYILIEIKLGFSCTLILSCNEVSSPGVRRKTRVNGEQNGGPMHHSGARS